MSASFLWNSVFHGEMLLYVYRRLLTNAVIEEQSGDTVLSWAANSLLSIPIVSGHSINTLIHALIRCYFRFWVAQLRNAYWFTYSLIFNCHINDYFAINIFGYISWARGASLMPIMTNSVRHSRQISWPQMPFYTLMAARPDEMRHASSSYKVVLVEWSIAGA